MEQQSLMGMLGVTQDYIVGNSQAIQTFLVDGAFRGEKIASRRKENLHQTWE